MKQIKVLIVNASQLYLESLKLILGKHERLQIIGEAHNHREVIQQIYSLQPDVVLLDIYLENEYDGIGICNEIVHLYPSIGVIMLSHINDKNLMVNSIRAGVRAFLAKDSDGDEIAHAIQTVVLGKGLFLSESISNEVLKECFGEGTSIVYKPFHLTNREIEVINLLSKGYGSKEIAKILYINTTTVESHKEHIKEKTGLKTVVEIVVFAIKNHLISLD